MKGKFAVLLSCLFLLFLGSCGSLELSPQACRSSAQWGASLEQKSAREYDPKDFEEVIEIDGGEYFTLLNREVLIRDILRDKGIECSMIKSMRVEISSRYFFFKSIKLKIAKK